MKLPGFLRGLLLWLNGPEQPLPVDDYMGVSSPCTDCGHPKRNHDYYGCTFQTPCPCKTPWGWEQQ